MKEDVFLFDRFTSLPGDSLGTGYVWLELFQVGFDFYVASH